MKLLILGANSDVAYYIAKKFAKSERSSLFMASRNQKLLAKKVEDLKIRYLVEVKALFFDATDYESHRNFYDSLDTKPDGVIICFGFLGDQKKAQRDFIESRQIIETNYLGAVNILEIIAEDFERRGHGLIIGISSVAGERGRKSNYIYGSAKGALTIYLSGLRNRLNKRNVRVITVLPGFIRTKMTENLDLPQKLIAEPEEVAEDIYQAYIKNKDVIYSKSFWKWIMLVIKMIPENLFKRTNI